MRMIVHSHYISSHADAYLLVCGAPSVPHTLLHRHLKLARPETFRMKSPISSLKTSAVPIAILLAISLGVTSCGKKPAGMPQGAATDVGVVVVTSGPVDMTAELSGRTSAYLVSEVRPQVGGIIKSRLFTEGGYVKQGQSLYQIDSAPSRRSTPAPRRLSPRPGRRRRPRSSRLSVTPNWSRSTPFPNRIMTTLRLPWRRPTPRSPRPMQPCKQPASISSIPRSLHRFPVLSASRR